MIRTLRVALVASLFALAATPLAAQTPAPTQLPVAQANGEIRGRLVEATSGAPISAGSITVRRASDSSFVSGALPAADGSFRVNGLRPGRYTVRFRAIGFAPLVRADVAISAEQPAVDLGQLKVASIPVQLADVVRAHTASGQKVLADDATADWLLWRLPELRGRVAYDVRFEVLTRAQIKRLLAWRNFGPGWQHVPAGYSVVVDDPAHVSRLVATRHWRRLLRGRRVEVAERIGSAG